MRVLQLIYALTPSKHDKYAIKVVFTQTVISFSFESLLQIALTLTDSSS